MQGQLLLKEQRKIEADKISNSMIIRSYSFSESKKNEDESNFLGNEKQTCASNIAQCQVWTVIATIMSSVTMSAENEIDTTWMKSVSNTSSAPYIITAPEYHVSDN